MPNPAVERDNQNAALFGSLRATRSGGRLCPTLNERPLFQTLSVAFGAKAAPGHRGDSALQRGLNFAKTGYRKRLAPPSFSCSRIVRVSSGGPPNGRIGLTEAEPEVLRQQAPPSHL